MGLEQIIILIIVGLFYFGSWLVKNWGGSASSGGGTTRPVNDEERLRRFMEALGQKPGTPPVTRTPPPIKPPLPVPAGNLRRSIPPVPPPQPVEKLWYEEEKLATVAESVEVLSSEVRAALARIEAGGVSQLETGNPWSQTPKPKVEQTSAAGWRQLLSSREGLKQAIVAQEILGTPVSLRS